MGNSQGQLKSSKFETALHMSIEQSLRSGSTTPHPLFSQLYLEKDIKLGLPDVLPAPPAHPDQEQRGSVSPRGSLQQEAVHLGFGSVPSTLAPRRLSPLPSIPGSIPVVHGPLRGVVLPPGLPPSSLAPNYHPQRFVLPGQFPPPHIIQPVLCNIPPTLTHRPRDRPSGYHRDPRQLVSPEDQRSPAGQSKPITLGGCRDVGFCKAGADIRLSAICGKQIDLPDRFVLVGATSPYLPEDILVVAVDGRFLPSLGIEEALHLGGFSGDCVGCGKKGFRFFNEFAHHINLRGVSVAKKEHHLRYYITQRQGRMTRGPLIPWQELPMDSRREPQLRAEPESLPDPPGCPSSQLSLPPQQGPDVKEEPDTQTGTSQDLKQPPKKRLRFQSLEEEELEESRVKRRMTFDPCAEFMPPPQDTKDCTFIPPDLAGCWGTKVVILECCGTLPLLHGHVSNVSVSRLFHGSLSSMEPSPSSSLERPCAQNKEVLNLPTRILVLVKYLLQLGSRMPYREGFDEALMMAGKEVESSSGDRLTPVTTEQLPSLAKLCAAASKGRAHVIVSEISLAVGLSEALQHLCARPSSEGCPEYTFVIHIMDGEDVTFCVVVSGLLQARALIEGGMTSSESLEGSSSPTGDVQLLTKHFARNTQGFQLNDLIAEFSSALDGKVFHPFNSPPHRKVEDSVAAESRPMSCGGLHQKDTSLHPCQIQAAMKLLSQVCAIADQDRKSLDLGRFTKVDLLIALPPSDVLYEQTVGRLHSSRILLDIGLDASGLKDSCRQFVMKSDGSAPSQAQIDEFIAKARSMPQALFVLIQDQAHVEAAKSPHGGCLQEVSDVPNILCLHVSSLPYILQTGESPIPLENEVVMGEHQDIAGHSSHQSRYFGVADYQGTLQWTNRAPLLQSDETFEVMAESLLKAYPELHSRLARTYLLILQYSAALLAVASQRSPKGSTDTTTQMVRDLINAPLSNEWGHGHTVLLRIPSPQLASLAYQRLRQVRGDLGLRYSFEVLLAGPGRPLGVDQCFLRRLRVCSRLECDSSWEPATYEDLDGLPCILILSGEEPSGKTLPQSLKVVDLRLVNEGMFSLTQLEQELGLACRHIDRTPTRTSESETSTERVPESDSGDQRQRMEGGDATALGTGKETSRGPPLVLVSREVYKVLREASHSKRPYSAGLPPSAGMAWTLPMRPLLTSDSSSERSSYYREWTVPTTGGSRLRTSPRQLLLCGPPQIGKTGAYLHFCRILHHMLVKLQEIEVNDDQAVRETGSLDSEITQGLPELSLVQRMTFDQTIYQERYRRCSLIWHHGLKKEDLNRRASLAYQDRKNSTVLLQSTTLSTHNAFHSCDECQSYRVGDSMENGVHHVKISDALFGEVNCQFIIPPSQKSSFVLDEQTGSFRSICLPLTGEQKSPAVKSPIFTLMRVSAEQSLVNLHHVMEGCDHVHILVCREKDSTAVRKHWPCHTVLVLPRQANRMGPGGLKYFIKRIAENNLAAEKQRYQTLGMDPARVWPLILIMEDWLASWKRSQMGSEVDVSLKTVMEHVETLPNITQYALLGVDQWSTKSKVIRSRFARTFVDNMVFLNVELTKDVQYNPYRFLNEDIDFSWRVNARDLPVCRLSYLQVMVKSSLSGHHPPEIVVHPTTPKSTGPVTAESFLVPLDATDCTLLSSPPHYLAERYLSADAFVSLPGTDVDARCHPVLVVDEYVSLGPRVPVCIVSSSTEPRSELTDVSFGGLVINGYLYPVPSEPFIRQFRFITGAKLLLIMPDAASSRRTISELALERDWKLQILQTANTREDGPITVIRGTYREVGDSD